MDEKERIRLNAKRHEPVKNGGRPSCPNCEGTNTHETAAREWCDDCGWSQEYGHDY